MEFTKIFKNFTKRHFPAYHLPCFGRPYFLHMVPWVWPQSVSSGLDSIRDSVVTHDVTERHSGTQFRYACIRVL